MQWRVGVPTPASGWHRADRPPAREAHGPLREAAMAAEQIACTWEPGRGLGQARSCQSVTGANLYWSKN